MRGKAKNGISFPASNGITPAYAGKRQPLPGYSKQTRDHPRVCGEKYHSRVFQQFNKGSPPRMRGKEFANIGEQAVKGITPAYAGKRLLWCRHSAGLRDHPRVCGEKDHSSCSLFSRLGSPPRMRGKAAGCPPRCGRYGITPAYAGKRLKRSHRIGHFSCILCLFHSVLHRASASGGSRAGPCAPPCLPAQNAVPV